MSQRQFSYLQNGQTVSEQERLKVLLAKDPTAVLSVCRSHLERSLGAAETVERAVLRLWKRSIDSLQEMTVLSRTCAERIPSSFGFFVSEKDRSETLKHTAGLLRQLDPLMGEIRSALLGLSRQEREMLLCHGEFLQAEKHLLEVIGATDALPNVKAECRGLLAALQTAQNSFDDMKRDAGELRILLQSLCGELLPRLTKELSGHADLSGDGKSCSVQRVRGLVGELQHVAEERQRTLLGLFRESHLEKEKN